MRILRFFAVFVLCLIATTGISPPSMAADPAEEQADALKLHELEDQLPKEASEIADGVSILDVDINEAIDRLGKAAAAIWSEVLGEALKNGAAIVSTAALCSVLSAIFGSGKGPGYISLAGVMAVTALSIGNMKSFLGLAEDTIQELSGYANILLPALTASASAAGAVTSAAVKYSATVLFMDVLISASANVIFPLICAYAAASVASAAFGGTGLDGASNLIKWLAMMLITIVMSAFIIYLTVTGVVASNADASATRVAKTTISTVLPVVGSMVSDAASTILSAAAGIRNAVGLFGLFAVSSICILPFIKLGLNYLVFKASAALASVLADNSIGKAVSALASSCGMALGVTGACAMMLFISILSVLRVSPL